MKINGNRYFSTAEILEELEISRQTLWRWRQEGKVPEGHRFRDGRLLFTEDEYEAVRAYAHRLEPATVTDANQMQLFSTGSARDTDDGDSKQLGG